jgi:hypothetical protein
VNPGRHEIVARSGSHEAWATVDAREGQSLTVALAFDTKLRRSEGDPSSSDPQASHSLPAATYLGLGIGAAGVAASGVSGLVSLLTRQGTSRACANHCPPTTWAEADREQRMLGRISGVGLALGAAGAGLAIGGLLMRQHPKSQGSTGSTLGDIARSLSVTPATGGVGLSVRF